MHRLLARSVLISRASSLQGNDRSRRSATKLAEPVADARTRKCVEINESDLMGESVTQSQQASDVQQLDHPVHSTMSLLNPAASEASSEAFEVPAAKVAADVLADKTPLPFEEIPGPAVLKLWEKYWKYVPLLGTQLFSSLLINRFTQGRLTWNRNVTPLKYLFNEYGCIVRFRGPLSGDIVMIHRPEHIAEVFKQEGEVPIRSGIDVLQHYRLNYRKYRLAGPFSLQGSEWLELREKVDRPFEEILSESFGKLEMVCDELVNRIRKIRNRQDEVPSNFDQELTRWGMESFCTVVLNRRLGFLESCGLNSTSEASRIIEALNTAHTYLSRCETGFQVWRFFETPFTKKLFTACDVLDSVIGKYIRQAQNRLRSRSGDRNARSEPESPVLEKLLLNQRIHVDDLATILMDMIILGVQATANCEAFLLFFLAKNPRVQRKLYEEIVSVLPIRGSPVTEENLHDMVYLKACLKESLRLRPAFPFITRLLPETITLHGYTIPKGTFVIMANEITSQREENFEDPQKFRPERWLAGPDDREIADSEYSCMPFGRGMRSCLGKNMAETQMLLLAAKLVQEFRIEYDYADIGSKYMMVNVPNRPLRFRFVDRD